MPGRERQNDDGQKLNQPDQAQCRSRIGALIEFPSDGCGLHFRADAGQHVPAEQAPVGRGAEGLIGIMALFHPISLGRKRQDGPASARSPPVSYILMWE